MSDNFDNSNNSNNSKYLCITASALMVPYMIYMNRVVEEVVYKTDKEIPLVEHGLAILLLIAIYASQWFWSNAVKHSLSHCVDKIIAKITIVSFLLYAFLFGRSSSDAPESHLLFSSANPIIQETPKLALLVALLFVFAAMSHLESSAQWCSDWHLFWHGGLHIISSICGAFVFL